MEVGAFSALFRASDDDACQPFLFAKFNRFDLDIPKYQKNRCAAEPSSHSVASGSNSLGSFT
jgi:hypothetical protein